MAERYSIKESSPSTKEGDVSGGLNRNRRIITHFSRADTRADRYRRVREQAKLSQTEFAHKLGVSQSSYSGYESGEREASLPFIIAVMKEYDLDANCLLLGVGEHDDMQSN